MEQSTPQTQPVVVVSSHKGLKVTTAIMSAIAACGICFGAYGILQNFTKKQQIADLEAEVAENQRDPAAAYQVFANNLATKTSTVFGYYYTNEDNARRTVAAQIKDAHLTLTEVDEDKIFAEIDGIIAAYFIRVGDGGVPFFYLVKKDGSAARLDISENSPRAIENLCGYDRIVSIFEGADLTAHLVDITGNVYQNS